MTFLYYLLEANVYLVIFYSFYRIFLHRETFHQFNRWYLLLSMVLAFAVPLLSIEYPLSSNNNSVLDSVHIRQNGQAVEGAGSSNEAIHGITSTGATRTSNANSNPSVAYINGSKINNTTLSTLIVDSPIDFNRIVLSLYLLGIVVSLSLTGSSLFRIIILYWKSPKVSKDGVTYVSLAHQSMVFSFSRWIFYGSADRLNDAVIAHELLHVRQGHSLDLLLLDIVRAFNFFNPLFYYLRRDLVLNHEFLADEYASSVAITPYDYALLLINKSCPLQGERSAQAFHGGQLESRLLRLNQNRSFSMKKFKYFLMLPILALIVFLSAFKVPKNYALIKWTLIQPASLESKPFPATKGAVSSEITSLNERDTANVIARQLKDRQAHYSDPTERRRDSPDAKPLSIVKTLSSRSPVDYARVTADTTPLKYWAPQYIRDSVTRYEVAASRLSRQMKEDAILANEILKMIRADKDTQLTQTESSSITSDLKLKSSGLSGKKLEMHQELTEENATDQLTIKRLKAFNVIIGRIENNYVVFKEMFIRANAFRATVRDNFPMHVQKAIPSLNYFIAYGGKRIPSPSASLESKWVQNEKEREEFFAITQ